MNSRVKQAQKEGATVGDISAGLSYSVIRNALQKVIRLRDPSELGARVVVQGGTFSNDAVLRAFELVSGREAVRPDVPGLMGASAPRSCPRRRAGGAAQQPPRPGQAHLLHDEHHPQALRALREQLPPHRHELLRRHLGAGRVHLGQPLRARRRAPRRPKAGRLTVSSRARHARRRLPNLFAWKYDRVFRYTPLAPEAAPRGVVGIPRVLNLYEDYPFWFTFFTHLGFSVRLSPRSSRAVYEAGIETIPSESVCYPGKLVHGHIARLLKEGVPFIFYPCIPHSPREDPGARNHFNCPIVTSYPEVVLNNIDGMRARARVRYANPFLPLHDAKRLAARLSRSSRGQE